jgi:hypothetical protein
MKKRANELSRAFSKDKVQIAENMGNKESLYTAGGKVS